MENLDTVWNFFQSNWEGITAFCALFLTIVELRANRKHNKLSVRPHLGTFAFHDTNDGILEYTYILKNDGLGPAIVNRFSVFFSNKLLVENDVLETQEKVGQKISDHFAAKYYVGAYTKGAVVSAGESFTLLNIRMELLSSDQIGHLRNFLDNFDLEIEYSSFYGDEFSVSSKEDKKRSE